MMAVKRRNAIVLSPPQTAVETAERTVEYIRDELARVDAPRDLVQITDRGFDRLLDTANRIPAIDGAGHSCTLHTDREERTETFAEAVNGCRAVGNQPGGLGLPGGGNGLDATLSLGGGVWGGNHLDEDLTYRHFIATTRVARPVNCGNDTDPLLGILTPDTLSSLAGTGSVCDEAALVASGNRE